MVTAPIPGKRITESVNTEHSEAFLTTKELLKNIFSSVLIKDVAHFQNYI